MIHTEAARALCTLAGAELCLARLTGGPLSPADVAAAGAIWCLLLAATTRPWARRPAVAASLVAVVGTLTLGPLWHSADAATLGVFSLLVALGGLVTWWSQAPLVPTVVIGWHLGLAVVVQHGDAVPPPPVLLCASLGMWLTWWSTQRLSWLGLVLLTVTFVPVPRIAWPSDQPDIVLITVDALRADATDGHATFDRLTEAGHTGPIWSNASWTLPALASMHTGVPPQLHGAGRTGAGFTALDPAFPTLAGTLATQGYDTLALSAGNPFTGHRYGLLQGFAKTWHPWEPRATPLPRGRSRHALPRPAFSRWLRPLRQPDHASALVDRALEVLDTPGEHFIWMHLMDVHLPWAEAPCRPEVLTAPAARSQIMADPWWTTPEGILCLRAGYDRAVDRVDGALGRLLAGVDPDRTIVMITADHGEALGDAGLEHGHTLLPQVTRVPLFLQTPDQVTIPAGGAPSLLDLPSTLQALAGLPVTLPGWDLTRDDAPPPDAVLWGILYGPEQAAVVDATWMLLRDDSGQSLRTWSNGTVVNDDEEPLVLPRLRAGLPSVTVHGAPVRGDQPWLRALGYVE